MIDITINPEKSHIGKNVDHICLQVSPFEPEQIKKQMTSAGVYCGEVENRFGATGFGLSIYIKDPDGNIIELKEG